MNLFVTGTDTDVGKTVVSAWICSKLNTSYLKLVQTVNTLFMNYCKMQEMFKAAQKLK